MDIFDFAMQMEKDGEAYYRQLAKQTSNKGLKKILNMLADDEVEHYYIIEKIKTGKHFPAQTIILADAKNVFVQMAESAEQLDIDTTQNELYSKAREIEKRSMDFYQEKANQMEEEYQREIFMALAEEEKKHFFLLENIIEFISRPKNWLENAEFYHLDEY